jgi:hypothetical protein
MSLLIILANLPLNSMYLCHAFIPCGISFFVRQSRFFFIFSEAAFSVPAYVPPPAASSYGTEAPSAFPSAFPSVAATQVNAAVSMLPANAALFFTQSSFDRPV